MSEHPNVARVRAYATERGVPIEVRRFPASTRTAEDAAREIGTEVERIVKSLVFVTDVTPVVALCSGAARVDEAKLAAAIGVRQVRRATAGEAKRFTGYAIGGVPPFAHATPCHVMCDERLARFDRVWAAAGLPDAVFPITPDALLRVSGGRLADVAA